MNAKALFFSFFFCVSLTCVRAQEQFSVFFDSNKFETNAAESQKLQDWIAANSSVKIVAINGYTDDDGTNGFNDTLAQKRVHFIFNKVKDKIKTREDFKTRSFGENFHQSKNKAENRKVTLYYILAKDLARENEILGITPGKAEPKVEEPQEIIPIEEEAMNFSENATLEDKIQQARKGTLIKLKDVNFFQNSFAVMPSAKPTVDALIETLKNHPKLKIEIQGHICCVASDIRNLSLDRARQIKRILVSEGIDGARIQVKGFGVSKPKFPIPEKNESEAALNRRVEIMILDK
ncbi:OmpA family protein [Flavobacterium aciduliphilum]|uniref:Outer membrane protein OmpA-like peptidoglycan-associated protein n=1 Tax=Flavobacterium aciduliphilum TaxID=1101402 RepID=A0A328YCA6_9FLAO|nr:OmpA family protein [Flavobacterium aciduliphilum]RAR70854.1 outer membrane protein OmpA-like peptidoglycan-associated protein [Flavobacterium aciduliphilum]